MKIDPLPPTALRPAPSVGENAEAEPARQPQAVPKFELPDSGREEAAARAAEAERVANNEQRKEELARVLEQITQQLNLRDATAQRKLRFRYDQASDVSVIQVYDAQSNELIRQIPSEEVLERLQRNSIDDLSIIDALV